MSLDFALIAPHKPTHVWSIFIFDRETPPFLVPKDATVYQTLVETVKDTDIFRHKWETH
jgi:hypothetical protein